MSILATCPGWGPAPDRRFGARIPGGRKAVAPGRSITHMPTAVINHLHFRETPDSDLLARAERELVPQARITEGIRGLHIVQVTPDHWILVILGDDAEVLDKFATEVGSPWMEYVVPLLASPPERHLGPLVVTTE